MNLKRNTARHLVIKMIKIKDKLNILKATRVKQQITYKGIPMRLSADVFLQKLCRPEGSGTKYSK